MGHYTIHFYNYYNNEFREMRCNENVNLDEAIRRAKNILQFYNRAPYHGNWATIDYAPCDYMDSDYYALNHQIGYIDNNKAYIYNIYGEPEEK